MIRERPVRERDMQRPKISLRARIVAFSRWRNDFGVILDPERLPNIWEAYLVAAELDIREQDGV